MVISSVKIANSAVTAVKISQSAITSVKIANSAVTAAKIAQSTITSVKIANSNITTAKINNAAVTSAKVAAGVVDNLDINMTDKVLTRPEIKDYSVTINAIGNATGAMSIDISLGNVVSATTTGVTTWTFSNPSPTTKACSFTLILTNGGSSTQNWPSPSVKWVGGVAPTLTASGVDILVFTTFNSGTTWYGVLSGADFK